MLTSFTLAGLLLPGSRISLFWCQPHSVSFWMVILIIMSIALSGVLRDSLQPGLRSRPFSRGVAWRPPAPSVPRRSGCPGARSLGGFPPGGGGREAGVPNDSPAFHPGEVLARAQLPQYRQGRALGLASFFWVSRSSQDEKAEDPHPAQPAACLAGCPLGPPCAETATLPLAHSQLPGHRSAWKLSLPSLASVPSFQEPQESPPTPQSCWS